MRQERPDAGAGKFDRLAAAVVIVLMLGFTLFLMCSAFFETVDINIANIAGEQADIVTDNFFLNIIILGLTLAATYLFYRHCDGLTVKALELVLMLWTLALGLGFIASVKLAAPWYSDSYIVTYAARRAAIGDYSALDTYFIRFPFQLGYALYEELYFRLTALIIPGLPEGYYCLGLQCVNLLWLLLGYHAIIRCAELLYSKARVTKMTALMLMFCLPAVFSCTFLYGNIPSLACGAAALWMFAEFIKKRRFASALLCALFMSLAVMLKLNLLIFFAAIAIVWLFELFRRWSFKSLLCLLLASLSVLALRGLPQQLYEERSGKSFGEGIPMIAWMAMGFSEGYAGPGWYSMDHTVTAFTDSGSDPAATAENARAVIAERLRYFAEEPGAAWRFFTVKLKTQWNDPSYESLWINKVQNTYSEKNGLYQVVCGSGERRTVGFMNQYQQFVLFGLLLALLTLWKKRDVRSCLLLIVILGGVLYHLLFEAKSQYCLSYFLLMIPVAASGCCQLFYGVENR